MPATAVGVDSERPSDAHAIARAKRPRLVALAVVLWVGALGAAAAIFHVAATEDAPGAASASAATATIASSPPSAAPAPTEASPASAPTDTTAPPSPAAAPSASGKLATTGILRVPRAVGRRIYVDGHIYGEGGKDLTVPCGSHKVRVGSAGTDHVREIPCGSVLEL
jgi:hypothetical protein